MKESPNYYAIVPANVRYADISSSSKLLYGEITALCNTRGYCWATNKYFAELYGVDSETVSRWISELHEKGFILRDISEEDGNKRKITLSVKMPRPIHKNVKHNNTSNITLDKSKVREDIFDLQGEIKKLEESPRRELNIIAFLLEEKKVVIENRAQLSAAIKRHIRDANDLKGFSNAQITKAAREAETQYGEKWTLRTLLKLLTK